MDYLMKGDSFMHKLSDTEIDFIAKKIKEQSLKSFAFSDELIDHVCCRIEQLMENGSTFESALNQSSHLYQRNEIKKIKKNFTIILNYSGFMNSLIIYASLLFYLGSWIFQWGQVDWVGLVAFVLISILIFRYSLLFYSDNNLRFKKSLVILSSVGFALFFIACLKRFLWLNFGFSGQHVMPVMLFSWLIISITGLIYIKALFPIKPNRLLYLVAIIQIALACLSLSTFIFPFTMQYIPWYATIIIIINMVSFLFLYTIRGKGKSFLRLILVSSSLIVFIYTPHRAIANNTNIKVQFAIKAREEIPGTKLFLYLNYYKYGKEMLILKKIGSSSFKSELIEFKGGDLKMSYVVLKDSLNLYDVLYDSEIHKQKLLLEKGDTVFYVKYNPNQNP